MVILRPQLAILQTTITPHIENAATARQNICAFLPLPLTSAVLHLSSHIMQCFWTGKCSLLESASSEMCALQAPLLSPTHSNRLAALGGLLNLIITLQGQLSKFGRGPTLPPVTTRCQCCHEQWSPRQPGNEMNFHYINCAITERLRGPVYNAEFIAASAVHICVIWRLRSGMEPALYCFSTV